MSVSVIPFRMFNKFDNLGDSINPAIIRACTDAEPVLSRGGPHLLGIGSILQMANPDSFVWGSGVMWPDQDALKVDPAKVFAVRGRLTRDHLHRLRLLAADVPLGDPGYLLPRLLGTPGLRRGGARIGIVPHHSHADNGSFAAFRDSGEVTLIDLRTRSMEPIAQMQACDAILSESLHGLIFAEALGIPNVWIASDPSERWTFKFRDWFSTMGQPQGQPEIFRLGAPLDVAALSRLARLHEPEIDGDALAQALPADALRREHTGRFVSVEQARASGPCRVVSDAMQTIARKRPAELPEDARKKAENQLRRQFAEYFQDWAEPRYLLVSSPDEPMRDTELAAAVSFLNARPDIACAFIGTEAELDARDVASRHHAGRRFLIGDTHMSASMVIRPNGLVSLAGPRLATCLVE